MLAVEFKKNRNQVLVSPFPNLQQTEPAPLKHVLAEHSAWPNGKRVKVTNSRRLFNFVESRYQFTVIYLVMSCKDYERGNLNQPAEKGDEGKMKLCICGLIAFIL